MASRLVKRSQSHQTYYGWPEDANFLVPAGVREHFSMASETESRLAHGMVIEFSGYKEAFPQLAASRTDAVSRVARGWDRRPSDFPGRRKAWASRDASGQALTAIAQAAFPGSSAAPPIWRRRPKPDWTSKAQVISRLTLCGRNFHFGIRENAMTASRRRPVLTKVRPFGSGISDLQRLRSSGAIRLCALMEFRSLHFHPRFDRPG